jgi:ABC-type antimicrobial peptide transport system permease subunit
VVIISAKMAQWLWLGASPIGKSIFMGADSWRIIGVVGDTQFLDVREQFRPTVYIVHRQFPLPPTRMIIRTKIDPAGLTAGVKARMRSLDKNLPQPNLKTMEQQYSKQLAEPRFYFLVFGFLGIVASALAAAGICGVVSYSVRYRTQELGLRVALGAKALDVLRLIILQAMKPVMIGIALGLAAAVGLTRFMSSLLYEINPVDARTFAAIGLITIVLAISSCYLSARPAIKVDPAEALRLE